MQLTDAQMRLYAITDDRWLNGRTLYDCVEDALKGGVTMLQIREKHCSTEKLTALAIPIVSLCHRYHVPCIINDDVQAAKDSGADGVHVGQDDTSIAQARAVLGAGKWIGTSAHNVAEARKAQQDGADYIGTGAVFGSATKQAFAANVTGNLSGSHHSSRCHWRHYSRKCFAAAWIWRTGHCGHFGDFCEAGLHSSCKGNATAGRCDL